MEIRPTPCGSCPWRKNTEWSQIPGISKDFIRSVTEGIELGKDVLSVLNGHGKIMQCHDRHSDRVCAGFILSDDAAHSIVLRFHGCVRGAVTGSASAGGADLHASWREVLAQKGALEER